MRLLAILISLEQCVEIVRGPGFAHRLGTEGLAMLGGWLGSLSPVKSLILGTGGRRKECQSACMHAWGIQLNFIKGVFYCVIRVWYEGAAGFPAILLHQTPVNV